MPPLHLQSRGDWHRLRRSGLRLEWEQRLHWRQAASGTRRQVAAVQKLPLLCRGFLGFFLLHCERMFSYDEGSKRPGESVSPLEPAEKLPP